MTYAAPFPWFGAKSRIAGEVWAAIGQDVPNYVEPFAGSAAALLARPKWSPDMSITETINDKDGMVANFWRAVSADPEQVAHYADWPSNENDLHARHIWLKGQKAGLVASLEGDPDFYDAKIAGWWCWGLAQWIGSGFCGDSGSGPWGVVDGRLVHLGNAGRGVARQMVHLGNTGQGVSRQRVHLGNTGQHDDTPCPECGGGGCGLYAWMAALGARLRRVRVACGDWERVCGHTPTLSSWTAWGVFLDPPYSGEAGRDNAIYAEEDLSVAHRVREWCVTNGENPRMRIVLAGYEGEHEELETLGWRVVKWKAKGGYAGQSASPNENAHRERLWLSPGCLNPQRPTQGIMFKEEQE